MAPQPTLTTARLRLRPLTLDDAATVTRLAGDFAVADTTANIPHPYEAGMAEGWISTHAQGWERGELAVFAIDLDGQLVGCIGLVIAAAWRRAELGYWIGHDHWGRGLATEAARAVVDWAFSSLALHRVFAYHMLRNPASGRVMEKVGMKREGVLRAHVQRWGKFEDVAVCGKLATD